MTFISPYQTRRFFSTPGGGGGVAHPPYEKFQMRCLDQFLYTQPTQHIYKEVRMQKKKSPALNLWIWWQFKVWPSI